MSVDEYAVSLVAENKRLRNIVAAWERRHQRGFCAFCGKHLIDRTQTHRKGCPYREATDGTTVNPS